LEPALSVNHPIAKDMRMADTVSAAIWRNVLLSIRAGGRSWNTAFFRNVVKKMMAVFTASTARKFARRQERRFLFFRRFFRRASSRAISARTTARVIGSSTRGPRSGTMMKRGREKRKNIAPPKGKTSHGLTP